MADLYTAPTSGVPYTQAGAPITPYVPDNSFIASPSATPVDNRWEITKGFARGVDNLQAMGFGALGLGADLVGADKAKEYFYNKALEQQKQAEEAPAAVAQFTDAWNSGDFSKGVDWFMGAVGEALPSSAASLVTGGAGAYLFKQMAGKLATNALAQEATKRLAQKYVADGVAKTAQEAAEMAVKKYFGAELGAYVGAMASGTAMESGSNWIDDVQKHGLQGTSPGRDLLFGAAGGALEAGLGAERRLIGNALKEKTAAELTKLASRKGITNFGIGLGKGMGSEGAEEFGQQMLSQASGMQGVYNPATMLANQDWQSNLNAGMAGAAGGFLFGAAGGAKSAMAGNAWEKGRAERERRALEQQSADWQNTYGNKYAIGRTTKSDSPERLAAEEVKTEYNTVKTLLSEDGTSRLSAYDTQLQTIGKQRSDILNQTYAVSQREDLDPQTKQSIIDTLTQQFMEVTAAEAKLKAERDQYNEEFNRKIKKTDEKYQKSWTEAMASDMQKLPSNEQEAYAMAVAKQQDARAQAVIDRRATSELEKARERMRQHRKALYDLNDRMTSDTAQSTAIDYDGIKLRDWHEKKIAEEQKYIDKLDKAYNTASEDKRNADTLFNLYRDDNHALNEMQEMYGATLEGMQKATEAAPKASSNTRSMEVLRKRLEDNRNAMAQRQAGEMREANQLVRDMAARRDIAAGVMPGVLPYSERSTERMQNVPTVQNDMFAGEQQAGVFSNEAASLRARLTAKQEEKRARMQVQQEKMLAKQEERRAAELKKQHEESLYRATAVNPNDASIELQKQQVVRWISGTLDTLKNLKNVVKIMHSSEMASLPDYVRKEYGGGAGVIDLREGKIYIVADKIKSKQSAVRVLLHESVAHFGLRSIMTPEQLDKFLHMVARDFVGSKSWADLAALYPDYDQVSLAEEYVAKFAEQLYFDNQNDTIGFGKKDGPYRYKTDEVKSIYEKIKKFFRNLLQQLGFVNVSEQDIREVILASAYNLSKRTRANKIHGHVDSNARDAMRVKYEGFYSPIQKFLDKININPNKVMPDDYWLNQFIGKEKIKNKETGEVTVRDTLKQGLTQEEITFIEDISGVEFKDLFWKFWPAGVSKKGLQDWLNFIYDHVELTEEIQQATPIDPNDKAKLLEYAKAHGTAVYATNEYITRSFPSKRDPLVAALKSDVVSDYRLDELAKYILDITSGRRSLLTPENRMHFSGALNKYLAEVEQILVKDPTEFSEIVQDLNKALGLEYIHESDFLSLMTDPDFSRRPVEVFGTEIDRIIDANARGNSFPGMSRGVFVKKFADKMASQLVYPDYPPAYAELVILSKHFGYELGAYKQYEQFRMATQQNQRSIPYAKKNMTTIGTRNFRNFLISAPNLKSRYGHEFGNADVSKLIFWVRASEYTQPNTNKTVLHIEEVQSDRIQAGVDTYEDKDGTTKAFGFNPFNPKKIPNPISAEAVDTARAVLEKARTIATAWATAHPDEYYENEVDHLEVINHAAHEIGFGVNPYASSTTEFFEPDGDPGLSLGIDLDFTIEWLRDIGEAQISRELYSVLNVFRNNRHAEQTIVPIADPGDSSNVPYTPLVQGYNLLAIKRMIKFAAENGYDAISWTPGVQQIDRWTHDLRASVESLGWMNHKTMTEEEKIAHDQDVQDSAQKAKFLLDEATNYLPYFEDMSHRLPDTSITRIVSIMLTLRRENRLDEIIRKNSPLKREVSRLLNRMDRWVDQIEASGGTAADDVVLKSVHGMFEKAFFALDNVESLITDVPFKDADVLELYVTYKDGRGRTIVFTDGKARDHKNRLQPLEKFVGKDIAKKINSTSKGKLEEDGLTIGGHGFKKVYDEELVNQTNRYIKNLDPSLKVYDSEFSGYKMHTFDITPTLKQKVENGQPVYGRTIFESRSAAPAGEYENARSTPAYKSWFGRSLEKLRSQFTLNSGDVQDGKIKLANEQSLMERLMIGAADSMYTLFNVEELVRQAGGVLDEANNPYKTWTLMHNVVSKQVNDFLQGVVGINPQSSMAAPAEGTLLWKMMRLSGRDGIPTDPKKLLEVFGKILQAWHAPEANRVLAEKSIDKKRLKDVDDKIAEVEHKLSLKNSTVKQVEEMERKLQRYRDVRQQMLDVRQDLYGMSNEEAAEIRKQYETPQNALAIQEIVNDVQQINKMILDKAVAEGLLDPEVRKLWDETYAYYVPNKKFQETMAKISPSYNRGGRVNLGVWELSKERMGTDEEGANPIVQLILKMEDVIKVAEEKKFLTSFSNMVEANPTLFADLIEKDNRPEVLAYSRSLKEVQADINKLLSNEKVRNSRQMMRDLRKKIKELELRKTKWENRYNLAETDGKVLQAQKMIDKLNADITSAHDAIDVLQQHIKQTKELSEYAALQQKQKSIIEARKALYAQRGLTRYIDNGVIKVRRNPSKFTGQMDRVVTLFDKDGNKRRYLVKNDHLLAALRGTHMMKVEMILRVLGAAQRIMAQLMTTYNPAFWMVNFFRDNLTAIIHARQLTEDIPGLDISRWDMTKKLFFANMPKTVLRELYKNARGGSMDPYWAAKLKAFEDLGGATTMYNIGNFGTTEKMLEKTLSSNSKPKQAMFAVMNYMSDVSGAIENSNRLAAFAIISDELIKSGRSPEAANKIAAEAALELTVNFTKKGTWGPVLSSLFLFSQASINSTVRIMRAMFPESDAGKGIIVKGGWKDQRRAVRYGAGLMATAFLLASAARALGGDDDDGIPYYDKLPDYVKNNNIIIAIGKNKFIKFPMTFGYAMPWAMGSVAMDVINGKTGLSRAMASTFDSMLQNFFIVGGGDEGITALTPTLFKPLVQIYANKNYFGGEVYPEAKSWEKGTKPDSQKSWKATNPLFVKAATALNAFFGGNKDRAATWSWFDISPASMEYAFKQYTGGVGDLTIKTLGLANTMMFGKDRKMTFNDFPIVSRFSAESTYQNTLHAYAAVKNEIETQLREYDRAKAEKVDAAELARIMKETRTGRLMKAKLDTVQKHMANVSKLENKLMANPNVPEETKYNTRLRNEEKNEQELKKFIKAARMAGVKPK